MKRPIAERIEMIQGFVRGEISKQQTAGIFGCSHRTIERYTKAFIAFGPEGLKDRTIVIAITTNFLQNRETMLLH